MLTVGNQFPAFSLKATVSEDLDTAFTTVRNDSYAGKWLVVFFWPKDFTFVCPTEIAEFGRKNADFRTAMRRCSALRSIASSSTSLGGATTKTSRACRSRCSRTFART